MQALRLAGLTVSTAAVYVVSSKLNISHQRQREATIFPVYVAILLKPEWQFSTTDSGESHVLSAGAIFKSRNSFDVFNIYIVSKHS